MRAALFALTVCCLPIMSTGCASEPSTRIVEAQAETAQIKTVLDAQVAAWNAGSIDGYMGAYLQSPKLRFASGGTVTRGWEKTRARYHRRYDTAEKMGTLLMSDEEIIILAPDAAIAHGRWQLVREGDKPSGLYTLVMRKIDGEWRIISDTTTSAQY